MILRHSDPKQLEKLAKYVIPHAHRRHIRVFMSKNIRLALKLRADGVHLPEIVARRGPLRIQSTPRGFMISAAAHSKQALWRAQIAKAEVVMISPVFQTNSHIGAKPLGSIRALRMIRHCPNLKPVALGGICPANVKRLKSKLMHGLAAIEAWST
ncbi:MAG: thiamine phosphate synthase [Magnetovibrio sp.]|nr:thiamine phosphate synthase [Magnetovibrio sp.]